MVSERRSVVRVASTSTRGRGCLPLIDLLILRGVSFAVLIPLLPSLFLPPLGSPPLLLLFVFLISVSSVLITENSLLLQFGLVVSVPQVPLASSCFPASVRNSGLQPTRNGIRARIVFVFVYFVPSPIFRLCFFCGAYVLRPSLLKWEHRTCFSVYRIRDN